MKSMYNFLEINARWVFKIKVFLIRTSVRLQFENTLLMKMNIDILDELD